MFLLLKNTKKISTLIIMKKLKKISINYPLLDKSLQKKNIPKNICSISSKFSLKENRLR